MQSATRQHLSRPTDVVIRVYDAPGNVTETHEHFDDFKKWLVRDALVATVVFE